MKHVCPEDWPEILARFQKALKPGRVLYVTVEIAEWSDIIEAYKRAKAMELPVVFGEVVEEIDAADAQVAALDWQAISGEQAGLAAYHYYPPLEQVRTWLDQAGLAIEEEGTGDGYAHFLSSKDA